MPERQPAAPQQPPPLSPTALITAKSGETTPFRGRGRKAGGPDPVQPRDARVDRLQPRRGPRGPAGAPLHRGLRRHPQRHPPRLRRPLRLRCCNTTTTGSGPPPPPAAPTHPCPALVDSSKEISINEGIT